MLTTTRRHLQTAHATWPLLASLAVVLSAAPAFGQAVAPSTTAGDQADAQTAMRVQLPPITVTAEKQSEDAQEVPASVTAVPKPLLTDADVRAISDATIFAPNTFFNEFSARKLSNARFRGVGSSPNNPAVTTYFDGVPQLNANSSSIELLDVDQVEFVRGPQSALFGRNTLGGLVSVASTRPSLAKWRGEAVVVGGDYGSADVRATASGPLAADTLAFGVGVGYSRREGFTTNPATGHALDGRSATFGKAQILWKPAEAWEARFIVSGERARDGDYALGDLAALRADPFSVSRRLEGQTSRDLVAPTVILNYRGRAFEVSSTTGLVSWKTEDVTDLNYSAGPTISRDNQEKDLQFTQEVRIASAKDAPLALSERTSLKWQAGVFAFTQKYEQKAVNAFPAFVLSPVLGFPVSQTSPQSTLDDKGVGVYGQLTATFSNRLDVTLGARGDVERKHATLDTFYSPAIAPPAAVAAQRDFKDLSPQVSVGYRPAAQQLVYATVTRGFKAGGFNAASPTGSEAYGEERSWNYEAGVKTSWLQERVRINGSAFRINWRDMQVNLPNPFVPGQYFIANAGAATSTGAEIEVATRLVHWLDVFGSVGGSDARFQGGSISSVPVGGNRIANAPSYTADGGVQVSWALSKSVLYGRADLARYGSIFYDDANTTEQPAYNLAHFRAGVRFSHAFVEVWIRNALDTRYIPVAFAYPGLAPSGFVGEMGAPRTVGVRLGVH